MSNLSPSEKYSEMKHKNKAAKLYPVSREFENIYKFEFDDFQIAGINALEQGDSVLIAAPTGAGKTIVGEFAAYFALKNGNKCFYTTPIKALSNQKYNEFVELFGAEKVGLLTGDTSINSEADIVVMTTEVLRNMLYSGSSTLSRLTTVVMDEVHYLADRFRGAVWEEVLIHLPESVNIAALSATVSNAEEFGEWLNTVRGKTAVIVSEIRPIPLFQKVLFENQLLDLFDDNQKVNREIVQLEKNAFARGRTLNSFSNSSRSKTRAPSRSSERFAPVVKTLGRPDVIRKLERQGLLPAIFFIFSRVGCESAVHQCTNAKLSLTTMEEKSRIRQLIAEFTTSLPDEDLEMLGFHEWSHALENGIAAHHAGLLPIFKETVEKLFQAGLIKVVFATETLALGVNMPARTVVLEKLIKWNGVGHVSISPGEFTQLTGRAGRRGIDIEGNAVIQWNKEIDTAFISSLASTRTYPLKSSFAPSYNMAVNLVSQMGKMRARHSLDSSFAQFQADKAVVGLVNQLNKNNALAADLIEQQQCHLGDFDIYAKFIYQLKELEKDLSLKPKRLRAKIEEEIDQLRIELKRHPSHKCEEREKHLRYASRVERLRKENVGLKNRIDSRKSLIGLRFDRLLEVMQELGYIAGEKTTPKGEILANIYGEKDLLIAETFAKVSIDDFTPSELAAFLTCFVYESRNEAKELPVKIPKGNLVPALAEMTDIWAQIYDIEVSHKLEPMAPPSLAFTKYAYNWSKGHSLTSILKGSELTAGDFVRSMKQVLDLCRQIRAAFPQNRELFDKTIKSIDRGVIAYSTELESSI